MIRFRKPALGPLLAFLVVLPVLIGLGFWQLDRAEQKRVLQADYDSRSMQSPIRISETVTDRERLRYYRVVAEGEYEAGHQFLLDNRVLDKQVGYHVITPLRLKGSQTRILVNRGWVKGNPDRSVLPEVPPPSGLQRVTGVAIVPHDKIFMLAKPAAIGKTWPPVWQQLDLKRFQTATGQALQPVVMLLDPDSEGGGLARRWRRLDTGIAVHQGYAFQWFSLAVALIAVFLFVSIRRPNSPDE